MDTELVDYLESHNAVGGIIKESYTAKFYKNKCEELRDKQIKELQEENKKLIDELECRNSTWETKEGEYEAEIKDKETIIEYLNTQLDKYKKLFGEIKKETDKATDIKGIMINEDKTIITINDVKLSIGDKFTIDNTTYTLKEIYIGKSSKISLRTDNKTIRLGYKYITGKVVINKFENKIEKKITNKNNKQLMLKYPRDSVNGKYDEGYETMEAEDKATNEYFEKNKARHKDAVKEFIDTYEKGKNDAVDKIKKLNPTEFNIIYWGYEQLYNAGNDKNKVIQIGNILNDKGGFELMVLTHYLFAWDLKAGGMCIGGFGRVVEMWWDGIGSWLG